MSKELNQDLILGDSVSTICLRSFGSPGFNSFTTFMLSVN